MAIHVPGKKFRYHRLLSRKGTKRDVVALLSLTAMVDMFTVLAIFLLQNYNTNGLVVNIPNDIVLPQASIIKELKPSIVVTISKNEIKLDELNVVSYAQVKEQSDWMIQPLFLETQKSLEREKAKAVKEGVINDIRSAVKTDTGSSSNENDWRKVTVQSDKDVDFLTVKKVLYTLTEAGAYEINFAVIKQPEVKN